MQCEEFDRRFNELLDQRGEPHADSLLVAHARNCPPCAGLLAGERQLFKGLQDTIFPKVTSGFSQRVIQRATSDAPPLATVYRSRSWPRGRVFGAGALIAAALLIAMSLSWNSRPGGTSARTRKGKVVVGEKNRMALATSVPIQNRLPAPLPHRSASGADDAEPRPPGLSLPGYHVGLAHYPEAIGTFAATLPGAVEQLDDVEHFAPSIRPIRVSFTMLLQALRSAMPGTHEKQPRSPHARLPLEQVERLA